VQHAWLVHQAIQTWTGQAETKATFLLPLESALFVFFGSQLFIDIGQMETAPQALVATIYRHNWPGIVYTGGLTFLFAGMVFLVLCVSPRLRQRHLASERQRDGIYFGHLRGLEEAEITRLFQEDPLGQLARQVKRASEISWRKHQAVKWSVLSASIGTSLIVLTYLIVAILITRDYPQ
jgi:hypothetical protein